MPVLIINYLPDFIRNSLYNVSNNISTAIIVGLMPFLINALMQHYEHSWITAILIINFAISLVSLLSIVILKKMVFRSRVR
jgi:threonine/homoserine/homoserine lactone efflux protein